MIYDKLFLLLEEVTGSRGKRLNKGEVIFYCPICNHYKPKLSVQLDKTHVDNKTGENVFGHWKCWVCQRDGTRGKSLRSLFKKLDATREQFAELAEILDEPIVYSKTQIDVQEQLRLPEEFVPLWRESKSVIRSHAIAYLEKRGIHSDDLVRYNLGYCEYGKYRDRIIIPSYDGTGKLNYFTGRSFYNNPYSYMNPPVSKEIIGFELFINWNVPIVLVEGPFDAMTVKRNVIPLFGKTVPNALRNKILQNKVSDIYIALDKDALKETLDLAEVFMKENINVYFVELGDDDPAALGYKRFQEILNDTSKMTFYDLISFRLSI